MAEIIDFDHSVLMRSPELCRIIDKESKGKSKDIGIPISEWKPRDFKYLYHMLLNDGAKEIEVWSLIDELYKVKYGGVVMERGGG